MPTLAPGEQNDLARELHEKTAELTVWQKATGAPIPSEPNPEYILE
jgi:hypothetical protein